MPERYVIRSFGEFKSEDTLPDAEYTILYDSDSDVSPEGLEDLAGSLTSGAEICVPVNPRGIGAVIGRVLYTIAAGSKVPVPCGSVSMKTALAGEARKMKRFDPNTVVMWSAARSIKMEKVELPSKVKVRGGSGKFLHRAASLVSASQTLRFAMSSFSSFLLDYALSLIFNAVIGNLFPSFPFRTEAAVLLAWIISSAFNFTINREFVFKSKAPLLKSLIGFYGFAIIAYLVKNLLILELFTRLINIPLFIAKPVSELSFFVFNFLYQKKFLFKKKPLEGEAVDVFEASGDGLEPADDTAGDLPGSSGETGSDGETQ